MADLTRIAEDYLALRGRLGHALAEAHWLLPKFVAHLEKTGTQFVTIDAALAWAQGPDVDPATTMAARRMTIARGFARHLAGIDPRTEIPPPGLIAFKQRWRPPYLFTPAEIKTLMSLARRLRWRLPAASHETLIGLLAATGMRVGEALRLDQEDIDWNTGILSVRESKFGKSRMVPIRPSTLKALDRYACIRDELCPRQRTKAFFASVRGNRLIYACAQEVFRNLCRESGIGEDAPRRPRLHDLRHGFAVRTLQSWYRAGADIEARLPILSTYLGHRDPRSTYWYLSAAPELLTLAAEKLELSREVMTR